MNIKLLTRKIQIAIWIVMLVLGINPMYAQDTLIIRGTVVDLSGNPVGNVSIGVEGSSLLPGFSDESGEFKVKALTGTEWLNISPPGEYKSKRVYLNKRNELKIYLTDAELASNSDVISVLDQDRLSGDLISAHSDLNTENIDRTSAITIDQYMQGRVPGMLVTNRSGDPGSGAFTLLRGTNSLNASNHPLYVIDGIIMSSQELFGSNLDGYSYNPLLALNVLDISQTSVLKDPSITAAYGSKASNGLVIVETLDPSATETIIELDIRGGYSLSPANRIPQLDANQHRALASELLFSSGIQEEIIEEEYPNLFLKPGDERYIDYQHNTNWQDLIFRDAVLSNINLSVKGGDEIARYGLSFGYLNAEGILRSTEYEGYNLRFVSLLNIFTWLRMNASASMNYSGSRLKESAKVSQTSPILSALSKSPMLYPFQYDEEGRELTTISLVDELGVSNPTAVIDNYEAKNSSFYFIASLGAEASLTENLELNSKFGLGYNLLKELIFMPSQGMELYYNGEAINVSKAANNSLSSFTNNTYLKYNKRLGGHHITSNTGINIQSDKFEYDMAVTKNASANDQYRSLQDGTANLRELAGDNRNWNWLSLYENLTYSYRDKYLAAASVSLDGSSRVGDNALNTLKINTVPFGLFYGVGLGWRISNESFLKNFSWLEELKLRLSYGVTGNDDIGEAIATNYYSAIKYRQAIGLYPAVLPNEELTYEKVGQLNGGLDLSLMGNRLSANVDLYSSVTNDMLIYKQLDSYYGYDFRPENGGQMTNKGVDLGLFVRVVDMPKVKWDVQATFSSVRNEVTAIEDDEMITSLMGAEIINIKGEQANSYYGYIFDGVYASAAEVQISNLVNEKFIPYQAGDAIFRDLSGPEGTPDGIINDYDKTLLGSAMPDYFGGIINTLKYRRFTLSAFVQFVSGNEIFNYVRYKNESMLGLENQSTSVLNRWQYDGQITNVPRAVMDDPIGNSSFSTRWIEDGSYVRLKSVELSYIIPDEFLAFKNAKFYVSANNLFTSTKYLGYDPEFAYSFSPIEQGIDYGLMPQPRQFIVGVKLGF